MRAVKADLDGFPSISKGGQGSACERIRIAFPGPCCVDSPDTVVYLVCI